MIGRRIFYVVLCAALLLGLAWSNTPAATPAWTPAAQGDLLEKLVSTADILTLQVNLPELFLSDTEMLDGNTYTVAQVEGSGSGEVSKPAVPILRAWILVPNGKTPEIEVINPGIQTLNDVYLKPQQPAVADLDDAPIEDFTIDEEVYQADADYPGFFANLEDMGMLRDQQVALLQIYPYQFNPRRRKLDIYDHMQVTVHFNGPLLPLPQPYWGDDFDDWMGKIGINAPEVLAAEKEVAEPSYGPYGWDYLIFTKSSFMTAANKLAAWKQKQGYKTLVTQVPSTWKADDIRTAIRGAYLTWDRAPKYILLLGDAEIIPTFYVTPHPYNGTLYKGTTTSQGLTGTDFYYSTLDDADPYTTTDRTPDVFVGRLSVDTAADAMHRVDGIITYEQNPTQDSTFYDTALLAAYFQDGGKVEVTANGKVVRTETLASNGIEDKRNVQTSEDLAIFLAASPQNKTIKRAYYTETTVNPAKYNDNNQKYQDFTNFNGPNSVVAASLPNYLKRPTYGWASNAADIIAAINAGAFLVIHRDHGGRLNWSHPSFDTSNAAYLNNPSRTPVVWSINCQTGWFDNETDFQKWAQTSNWTPASSESLSEMLERPALGANGNYGAVGIVAASRVSYGSYNEYLYLGMANAIWPGLWSANKGGLASSKALYQMAEVMNVSKAFMIQKAGKSDKGLAQLEGYHWFGDPAMEIRTTKPPLMIAVKPDLWKYLLLPHLMEVHIDWAGSGDQPSGPVEGARVTIFKEGSPEDYWVSKTDSEGNAAFPELKVSQPGEYQIMAGAPNAVPYQGTFQVEPGSAGGVGLDAHLYRCGESINIAVADADLASSGRLEVLIETTAGDAENVVLSASDTPGYFTGGINSIAARPNPGDGILQIGDGVEIIVTYQDANDGTDHRATVTDIARGDCLPPVFDGLQRLTQGACSVALGWEPAMDDSLPIQYNIYRDRVNAGQAPESPILIGSTFATSFNDYACWPGRTYEYMVRAQDQAGLEDGNNVTKSVTYGGFFLPIIMK
jgi:hypothetical protein